MNPKRLIKRIEKILLLGLLFMVALIIYKGLNRGYNTSEAKAKEILLDSLSSSIDSLGREIIDLEQINISEKSLNKVLTDALNTATLEKKRTLQRMQTMYSEAQKRIKAKDAKIVTLTTAISTMETTIIAGLTDTIYQDSSSNTAIPAWGFDQSNEYLTFKGFVLPSTKTIIADIEADLSFTHTIHKKNGVRRLELIFDNPYIRTTNAMTIDLGKTQRKGLGLDISLWTGVDYRGKASAGIGLSKKLISF